MVESKHGEVILPTVNLGTVKARFEGLPVEVKEVATLWTPHEYIVWPAKRLLLQGKPATPRNITQVEYIEHAGCCGMYVHPLDPYTVSKNPVNIQLKRCTLPFGRHDVHRFIRLALTAPVSKQDLVATMDRVKMQLVAQLVDGFQIYPETEKFLLDIAPN
jgi:hypothetical protein